MSAVGFPRNLGGPAASARHPERGVTGYRCHRCLLNTRVETSWPASAPVCSASERLANQRANGAKRPFASDPRTPWKHARAARTRSFCSGNGRRRSASVKSALASLRPPASARAQPRSAEIAPSHGGPLVHHSGCRRERRQCGSGCGTTRTIVPCPQRGELSQRQHSRYERRPFDLPWRGQTVRMRGHS
jgi:hypothetical protein